MSSNRAAPRVQGQVPQGMMMKGPAPSQQAQMMMMRGSPSHSMDGNSQHSGSRVSLSSTTGQPQVVYENLDYYGDNV